jgi:hypothetical protein
MKLTPRQIRILLVGHAAGAAGRGFLTEREELTAWMRHRETLLAAAGSARPAAYLKFELCQDTPQWIFSAEQFFYREQAFAKSAPSAEHNEATMAGDQPADLHAEFETAEKIRALALQVPYLERLLREFGFAQAWHAFRDRAALESKYARIGAALRQVLRESLTILKPKEEN